MHDPIFKTPKTRFALIFQPAAVAMTAFTLIRAILFARAWTFIDHPGQDLLYIFGQGLVYDIAFTGYFAIPFVLILLAWPDLWARGRVFQALARTAYFLVLYGIGFNIVAEWCFWSEFGVRFNFISVDYLVYRREVTNNILESYPVFVILPVLLVITAIFFRALRGPRQRVFALREPFAKRLLPALCLLMVPLILGLLLNQSQRRRSDNNYVNELASNGPYQLFAAFRNNTLDYREFYSTGNDKRLSGTLKHRVQDTENHSRIYDISRYIAAKGAPQRLNVMLITVESLSAKFFTRFGQKENITPFMDQWFKKGQLFTRFYATGTRTTRGLEAITLSIPPTPGRSIVKRPDNGGMYSLGKVFRDQGYDTAFIYGGRGFFDNMNAFFSKNGYRIVDQTDIGSNETTFENAWGVCDEDLYNRALKEADQSYREGTPFFFHLMTTSNHQPFTFPKGKIDLTPGEGNGGSGRFGAVKYTDYALGQLMKNAAGRPWFKNTVFLVVADHCAASAGKVGLPVNKYHIPLFIYSPGNIPEGEVHALASQIDLAPTLLALLNVSYESFFFGRNILAKDFKERAFIANYQKLGLLTDGQLLFLSPGKKIHRMALGTAAPVLETVSPDTPGVRTLMSYYQGADYIFTHGLNRWRSYISGITDKKQIRGEQI